VIKWKEGAVSVPLTGANKNGWTGASKVGKPVVVLKSVYERARPI